MTMKRFYRQRKKGVNNKPSKSRKKSKVPTTPLQAKYDPKEEILMKFDMDMTYGPCVGMTRQERWKRAQNMGLNPPKEIESFLKSDIKDIKIQLECLWNKRIHGSYKIIEYFNFDNSFKNYIPLIS
ncbi:PREDICTED: DNA polymerase delta subunit 4-like [Lupinus angustifolius]|uniref:DNA polymerase delta subunit 4-like n=1 Tax=Lupinus angustifolius TaxID=3871 RepID=UPI00092E9EE3|nr:PREDICTED: DNA polymerase delta subunit 4-like [Lupinus angustifolius]